MFARRERNRVPVHVSSYYTDDKTMIFCCDCRDMLSSLPAGSIDCCVTSPPYWGLRDYGVDGQLGLESTLSEYIQKLVEIFWQVRRVLRNDGTLWLNLGDSYCGGASRGDSPPSGKQSTNKGTDFLRGKSAIIPIGLKPKDLVGVPWRVAFALQADGWYLRSDIIWHKPNPMPESVRDRPTKAHEYLFLLAKSKKYHYDADAIKEDGAGVREWRKQTRGSGDDWKSKGGAGSRAAKGPSGFGTPMKRNKRTVWTITPRSYRGAHFATYPPELIEPCILAGCRLGGTVLDPFGGSGTTGFVANSLGRKAVLCELNEKYIPLIKQRLGISAKSQQRSARRRKR